MFGSIAILIEKWLITLGFSPEAAVKTAGISDFLMILLLGVIIYYISKIIIVRVIKRIQSKP